MVSAEPALGLLGVRLPRRSEHGPEHDDGADEEEPGEEAGSGQPVPRMLAFCLANSSSVRTP